MRTHLLWLLPLILLGSTVQALQCHECNGIENCYRPTSCNTMSRYCLTSWHTPSGQQPSMIKACAFTCPDVHQSQVDLKTSCCNTDLCNSSVNLHVSWGLLTLSIWCICLSR